MSVSAELRAQILGLPRADRAELAHDLLLSLDRGEPSRDPDYEAAWAAELEERWERYESGESESVPFEEAIDQAREELRRRRRT